MIFRTATISDAEAISQLVLAFRHEYLLDPTGRGAEQFLASVSAEAERGYIGSSRYYYLLGEVDGVLAGVIALRDGTHLFRLFVARNFQRQGLARELWRRARQALGPVDQTMNFTVNSSPMAVPVYRRLGFEQTAPREELHGIASVPMRLTEVRLQPDT